MHVWLRQDEAVKSQTFLSKVILCDVEAFDEILAWPVGVADVGSVLCTICLTLAAARLVVAVVDGYALWA